MLQVADLEDLGAAGPQDTRTQQKDQAGDTPDKCVDFAVYFGNLVEKCVHFAMNLLVRK